MKIVITGGTGLIGRALTDHLIATNNEVIILSRNPERAKDMPDAANIVQWDAKTAGEWVESCDGVDAIVNLAGASIDNRWTEDHKQRIKDSRINAGQAVIEGIKAMSQKPKVVIQASAVGYYGPRKDEIITEESDNGNDFLAGVCQEWEDSTKAVEEMGVRRCVIRTGLVLSTKGGALGRLLPVFKGFAGGPVGSGKQYYPWIHIGDEVGAIHFLIEHKDANGIFNLSAPNPVPNKEFSVALGKALNRPAIAPAPAIAMKIMFGEMSTIILDGQRAIPQHLLDSGYAFRFNDPEAAFRHLLYSGAED